MAHIDTLKYYEDLIKAGNSELEAKAHIYVINNSLSDLVTKDDLHAELGSLGSRIDAKLDMFRSIFIPMIVGLLMLLLKIAFWP